MFKLSGTSAIATIATFIALHNPDGLFAMSADLGGVANGKTSSENLHDLARLIQNLPMLS